ARKAIGMFGIQGITLPVLGVIENMAYFTPPGEPGKVYYIFGQGGGQKLAKEYNIPFLGEIPLAQPIREAADEGLPLAQKDKTLHEAYIMAAANVARQVAILNAPAAKAGVNA
ncbi:MAG TPA: P-loop NTPase, partial [Bacteroidia bacterium]|nr:P-loop NTPase [Bacteroidia bacterium]